ncbi:MAG: hypothetical protein LUC23_06405 [Prevotellaceae bacterium]|nr:hypothetical protein [Prevotellaceae bacterium]
MKDFTKEGVVVQKTTCRTDDGQEEIHLLLSMNYCFTDDYASLLASLLAVCEREAEAAGAATIFQRFFVHDADVWQSVIDTALSTKPQRAVSIVEQPPADGSQVALWAYLATGVAVTHTAEGLVVAQGRHYMQIWATNMVAQGTNSREQTMRIFHRYIRQLECHSMTLESHCQRTWIFVDDIGRRYRGMVEARNNVFDKERLTADRHFIASTGISGANALPDSYVMFDAVAYQGLAREDIRYLHATARMNRTSSYGVRFERGVALDLNGFHQVFISGTASIDQEGKVAHAGNVLLQTERLMGHVEALLAEAGCTVKDIQQALVYLRDKADYDKVTQWLDTYYPQLPCLLLHAPVCRPDWLVEVECMAGK